MIVPSQTFPPDALRQGILYFPAEAEKAQQLRLQAKDARTGETRPLFFPL